MLKPILEEKGLLGSRIKAAELAKICRNHRRRLPLMSFRALDLADDFNLGKNNAFILDEFEISVYMEVDFATRRRSPEIEIQLAVSLEQQYLDELAQREVENAA